MFSVLEARNRVVRIRCFGWVIKGGSGGSSGGGRMLLLPTNGVVRQRLRGRRAKNGLINGEGEWENKGRGGTLTWEGTLKRRHKSHSLPT